MHLFEQEAVPEYEDIRNLVVFVKLPSYSPDLNTIGQVWRITRREKAHNVFSFAIPAGGNGRFSIWYLGCSEREAEVPVHLYAKFIFVVYYSSFRYKRRAK